MRNPFFRQTETAAPTLRERAADLRAGLTRPQQPEPVAPEPEVETTVDWHMRAKGDAELMALSTAWAAAADHLQQRADEEHAVVEAAPHDGRPGPVPVGTGSEWDAYLEQKQAWRDATGISVAEEASSAAASALHEIELRIASLPAASLAGLKLKARVGQRYDDLGLDWPDNLGAGLARDILAFAAPKAHADELHAPAVSRSPRAALPLTTLAHSIDFTAASMSELLALRDTADLLGDAANATVWQGRCRLSDHPSGAYQPNTAGKFMAWMGDALSCVAGAATSEARRRSPETEEDRKTRLSILAVSTIDNDDLDETEAFARELLALVGAVRARG